MERTERRGVVGGMILVTIGVLALLSRFLPEAYSLNFATLLLGSMALIFLIAGIFTRQAGYFFPAGILGGVAAGVWATNTAFFEGNLNGGGLFMLMFAAGWATIPITTALFTRERHWWVFIIAAVFATVGFSIAYGGAFENVFRVINLLWPLGLIIGGVFLLWQVSRGRGRAEENPPVEKRA